MKTEKQLNWKLITTSVIGWLAVFVLVWYIFHLAQRNEMQTKNEMIAADSIKYLKNENKTLTASVGTYQMTASEFRTKFMDSDQELKKLAGRYSKLSTVTRITASAKITEAASAFDLPINAEISMTDSVNFERKGTIWKDWFCTNYTVTNDSIKLSDIEADFSVTTITGFQRKWFLGRQIAVTEVTPNKPGIIITQVQSTSIVVPVKFYETKIFLIATGFLFGTAINQL